MVRRTRSIPWGGRGPSLAARASDFDDDRFDDDDGGSGGGRGTRARGGGKGENRRRRCVPARLPWPSRARCSSIVPPPTSPAGRTFLLALSSLLLASVGWTCAWIAGTSCSFVSIEVDAPWTSIVEGKEASSAPLGRPDRLDPGAAAKDGTRGDGGGREEAPDEGMSKDEMTPGGFEHYKDGSSPSGGGEDNDTDDGSKSGAPSSPEGLADASAMSEEDRWYRDETKAAYEGLLPPDSLGIFCSNHVDAEGGGSAMRTLSRAFLSVSLGFGALLLVATSGIVTTALPPTSRLWTSVSIVAALAFASALPTFLILDDAICRREGTVCSLGEGSVALFVGMGAYLTLAVLAQWKDPPDWKEEYALWKLMSRTRDDGSKTKGSGKKRPDDLERDATEECDLDEEAGLADGDDNRCRQLEAASTDKRYAMFDDSAKSTHRRPPPPPPMSPDLSQGKIERLDLLGHDDLIPDTNDTPLVVRPREGEFRATEPEAADDAERRRTEDRRKVSERLREERLRSRAKAKARARGRKDDDGEFELPPVPYISVDDSVNESINRSLDRGAADASIERKADDGATDGTPPPVATTPPRSPGGGGGIGSPDDNVSPITHGSRGSRGSPRGGGGVDKSASTEDYGIVEEEEDRDEGDTAGADLSGTAADSRKRMAAAGAQLAPSSSGAERRRMRSGFPDERAEEERPRSEDGGAWSAGAFDFRGVTSPSPSGTSFAEAAFNDDVFANAAFDANPFREDDAHNGTHGGQKAASPESGAGRLSVQSLSKFFEVGAARSSDGRPPLPPAMPLGRKGTVVPPRDSGEAEATGRASSADGRRAAPSPPSEEERGPSASPLRSISSASTDLTCNRSKKSFPEGPPPVSATSVSRPDRAPTTGGPAPSSDDASSAAGSARSDRTDLSSRARRLLPRPPSIFRKRPGGDDGGGAGEEDEDDDASSKASLRRSRRRGVLPSLSWPTKKPAREEEEKGGNRPAKTVAEDGRDSAATVAVVSPEKRTDRDPDVAEYPSESSLSELSLRADECRSADDDDDDPRRRRGKAARRRRNDPLVVLAAVPSTGSCDDSDASSADRSEELFRVVAGVLVTQELNRLSSGKITPLNKRARRRRRRKGGRDIREQQQQLLPNASSWDSSDSDEGGYSSCGSAISSHGSLLDEVIVEEREGELDGSGEVPGTSAASASASTAWKEATRSPVKAKIVLPSPRSKKRSSGGYAILDDDVMPYDDEDPRTTGRRHEAPASPGAFSPGGSDSDASFESTSSRAARARRSRIASEKRRWREKGDEHRTTSTLTAAPDPDGKSPTRSDMPVPRRDDDDDDHVDPRSGVDERGRSPSEGSGRREDDGEGGGDARDGGGADDTKAWRARRARMARLRTNRAIAATRTSPMDREEDEDEVVRASEGIVLACGSDEDSI